MQLIEILAILGTGGVLLMGAVQYVEDCSKIKRAIAKVGIVLGLGLVAIFVLLPLLYWLWYYLCGGFLVIEAAESFWEQVVYGGITLIGVVFWVGLIMILLRKM